MDFINDFESQFQISDNYIEADLDLNKKLQDTRHALQESVSETDQLVKIIELLYSEAMVEQVATGALIDQVPSPLFKNISLPRNADSLPLSEKAGYAVYYLKFLGYTARKATEEYHKTKEHLEGIHKSVRSNVVELQIKRTGDIKIPDLSGDKEMKRGHKTAAPPTPPVTPPNHQTSKEKRSK